MEIAIEKRTGLQWVWISLIVIIIDQLTKYLMAHTDPSFIYLTSFLDFALAHNTGAAFSFLSHTGSFAIGLFIITAVVISLFLGIWLYRLPRDNYWLGVSLSLILGGAIGNLLDRILYGYVIDFIHVHTGSWSFPIFNMADTAITIGAFMLIIDIFRKR